MNIEVDTEKMREAGEDIIKLVEELKKTYATMFERFESSIAKTTLWVGESAEVYAGKLKFDKIEFSSYIKDLYKYGKYLIDCANYYEKTNKKLEDKYD